MLIDHALMFRSQSANSHESEIGEGVLSCAFGPTGKTVVTTTQNGAVRVSYTCYIQACTIYYVEIFARRKFSQISSPAGKKFITLIFVLRGYGNLYRISSANIFCHTKVPGLDKILSK